MLVNFASLLVFSTCITTTMGMYVRYPPQSFLYSYGRYFTSYMTNNPWKQCRISTYEAPTCKALMPGDSESCKASECMYTPTSRDIVLRSTGLRRRYFLDGLKPVPKSHRAQVCKSQGRRCANALDCNPIKFPNTCHCCHYQAFQCVQRYRSEDHTFYRSHQFGIAKVIYKVKIPNGCSCSRIKVTKNTPGCS